MQQPSERCKQQECCQMGLRSTIRARKKAWLARDVLWVRSEARVACMVSAVSRKMKTRIVGPICKNVHMCCCMLGMCETRRVCAYGWRIGSCVRPCVCEARKSFRLPPHVAGWHATAGKRPDGHFFTGRPLGAQGSLLMSATTLASCLASSTVRCALWAALG